jgi:hypothetical protein
MVLHLSAVFGVPGVHGGAMHHQRIVLNGPEAGLRAAAAALGAAGATPVAADPPRFVWTVPRGGPLEALAARHPDVVFGVERFAALGATFEHVILHGAEVTSLARRRFAEAEDEETTTSPPVRGAARVAVVATPRVVALRRAARAVAAEPTAFGPATGTTLDDALLVAPALGRLAAVAGDPLDDDRPSPQALAALRALGAIGLTVGASCDGPACDAELEFERAWRLAQAHACAGDDPFADDERPDWPDWLMFVLSCGAGVIEACAASLHRGPPGAIPVHHEHYATADEQLEHAAALLTITTIQALALFAPRQERDT